MKVRDLGFNENFIEIVENANGVYQSIQKNEGTKEPITLDQWIQNNIEECEKDTEGNILEGFSEREKYIFIYGILAQEIVEYVEE